MVPAETSPAGLFGKMFLQGDADEVKREERNLASGGSILDHLKSQTASLRGRVSAPDQRKLDAYFDAVRTAEQELTEARSWLKKPKPVVDAVPPTDIPDRADLIGRIRLMFDMIPLILETDSSRVVSLMIQDHGVVPQVGVELTRGLTSENVLQARSSGTAVNTSISKSTSGWPKASTTSPVDAGLTPLRCSASAGYTSRL